MILAAGYRVVPVPWDRRGQPEGEAAAFLQAGHGRVDRLPLVLARAQYLARTPPDEEAGSPQWQFLAGNRDRLQRQANIAVAAPPIGSPCRLDSPGNGRPARHSRLSIH